MDSQPRLKGPVHTHTHTHTSIEKGKSVIISRIYTHTQSERKRGQIIKYKEMKRKEKSHRKVKVSQSLTD